MSSDFSGVTRDLRCFLKDSLQVPPSQSEPRFRDLALRLFRLQYRLIPPYRALCDARGIRPGRVNDWQSIPAVPTSGFKTFAFTCIEEPDRTACFESSGTTQTNRSRQHHSVESLLLYEASLLPWFQRHLIPEAALVDPPDLPPLDLVSLTPPLEVAPHSSLVYMLHAVSGQPWFARSSFVGTVRRIDSHVDAPEPGDSRFPSELGQAHPAEAGGWEVDFDAFRRAITQAAAKNHPVLLAGTAFNFIHLLDALTTEGLSLPAGSRIMETGGYKGRSREMERDELHAELSRVLGVRPEFIVTEYGMTELGSQAYDRVATVRTGRRTLKFPPWARSMVVSTETGQQVELGESGLVRVVDLANVFAVVAIETEDVAVQWADGIELQGRRTMAEPRGCSLMAM